MTTAIITPCTKNKCSTIAPIEFDADVCSWRTKAQSAPKIPAGQLYSGRSASFAKRAADLIGADLYFASAGFGLISEHDEIPNYNATVAHLINAGITPSDWWDAVTTSHIADIARRYDIVLIALSARYAQLLQKDLEQLEQNNILAFVAGQKVMLPSSIKHRFFSCATLKACGVDGVFADKAQRSLLAYAMGSAT